MCFFLRFGTPNALGEKENGNENEKEKRDAECVVFLDRLRSARLLIFPSRSSGSFGIGICGVNFPHFLGNQSMPRQRQFVVVLLSNCIQVEKRKSNGKSRPKWGGRDPIPIRYDPIRLLKCLCQAFFHSLAAKPQNSL